MERFGRLGLSIAIINGFELLWIKEFRPNH
jgi:hypothetical protein